jgi:hypothetical protein
MHYNKTYKEGFNYTAYEKLAILSFPNLIELKLEDCGINN